MKKLSDLGISPPPWNIKYFEFPAEYGGGRTVGGIVSRNGGTRVDWNMGIADARLVASAPRLYECLHAAIEGRCSRCNASEYERRRLCDLCIVADWKSALAEAAGESEVK